ncbi:MAG: hypothetical protein HY900_35510 [Deltaproteobacteria bacterium]|nr:hypothetical protein [Deltaproteobacteria bacterium]
MLAGPSDVPGTDYVCIPLLSEKKGVDVPTPVLGSGIHSYSGGYAPQSRNLLFLNRKTAEMKWLFPNNRQLITEIEMLSPPQEADKGRKVDAILYRVITEDTNGDMQLTSADAAAVTASTPDGSRYKYLFGPDARVIGAMDVGDQRGIVLYQLNGRGYASILDLSGLSIIATREIPKSE